jgi:hypothetical protein
LISDSHTGEIGREWPLVGGPDATFFNPNSGLVHVAIGDPGLIQSIDRRTGASTQFMTAVGATTTALIEPDRLYVFSPVHKGILELREEKPRQVLHQRVHRTANAATLFPPEV